MLTLAVCTAFVQQESQILIGMMDINNITSNNRKTGVNVAASVNRF